MEARGGVAAWPKPPSCVVSEGGCPELSGPWAHCPAHFLTQGPCPLCGPRPFPEPAAFPGARCFPDPASLVCVGSSPGVFSPGVPSAPGPPRPSRTVGALPTVGQAWAFMLSLTPHNQATRKPNHITINRFSCPPRLPPWTKPPWPLPCLRAPSCVACISLHSSPFGSQRVPFKT